MHSCNHSVCSYPSVLMQTGSLSSVRIEVECFKNILLAALSPAWGTLSIDKKNFTRRTVGDGAEYIFVHAAVERETAAVVCCVADECVQFAGWESFEQGRQKERADISCSSRLFLCSMQFTENRYKGFPEAALYLCACNGRECISQGFCHAAFHGIKVARNL